MLRCSFSLCCVIGYHLHVQQKRYVSHIDCCSEHHTATRRAAGMNELQNPQTPTLPNALGGAALSL